MAIFTDIHDFRQHAPQLHLQYNWDKLARVINQVIRSRIWPYISEAEYLTLEAGYLSGTGGAFSHAFSTAYDTSPALDVTQEKAVEYMQDALAHYTMLHLMTSSRVHLSEMGVMEGRSSDGTSTPASFHAIQDVKDEYATMAYDFMDQLLQHMEDNVSTFPDWEASDEYTEIKELFVWNTKILNDHVTAGLSRHTFLSLRSHLKHVQENVIRSQLGNTLTDALLAALKANTLDPDQTKLVEYLQAWISPTAMVRAMPFFRIEILHGSIYFRSQLDGPARRTGLNSDIINSGPAGGLLTQLQEQSETARGRCLTYLEDNISLFPDYAGLEYDLWDGDPSQQMPDNSWRRSFRT